MEKTGPPEASAPPYLEAGTSSIPGVAIGEQPPSYEAAAAASNCRFSCRVL